MRVKAAARAGTLLFAALVAPAAAEQTGRADRVFLNGRIWTADPARPLAEAIAMRGPTLLAVGGSGAVRRLAGRGTEVVDLRGRFVVPGFIDAHLHLLSRLVPKLLPHEKKRALESGIAQAAAWGLTSVHDAGIAEADLEIYASALDQVRRLRVYAALEMERVPTAEALARQQALRARFSSRWLRVGAVKGYVDGVGGLPDWTQEALDRAVAAYDAAGWQVMLHAIGDRGIDRALTAFERAARANRTKGLRHRVEHLEVPRPAELARLRAAGIVDDAGVRQAFGCDWPVASADVLRGIACAVTRTTTECAAPGGWQPTERLTVEAALRHFTCDAAYAEHAEGEKGRLAPGLAADFVVLSQDLLAIPPERIKDTQVLHTVLAGQDTFRAQGPLR